MIDVIANGIGYVVLSIVAVLVVFVVILSIVQTVNYFLFCHWASWKNNKIWWQFWEWFTCIRPFYFRTTFFKLDDGSTVINDCLFKWTHKQPKSK